MRDGAVVADNLITVQKNEKTPITVTVPKCQPLYDFPLRTRIMYIEQSPNQQQISPTVRFFKFQRQWVVRERVCVLYVCVCVCVCVYVLYGWLIVCQEALCWTELVACLVYYCLTCTAVSVSHVQVSVFLPLACYGSLPLSASFLPVSSRYFSVPFLHFLVPKLLLLLEAHIAICR